MTNIRQNVNDIEAADDIDRQTRNRNRPELTPWDFKLAARWVIDAQHSRDIDFKLNEIGLKLYELYLNKWVVYFVKLILFLHIAVLPFFEEPAYYKLKHDKPFMILAIVEFVFLLLYSLRFFHFASFQKNKWFICEVRNRNMFFHLVLIIATFIDLIQYSIFKSYDPSSAHRITRCFRVFFCITTNEGKEIRRAFRNVKRALPDIINVFVLFLTSLTVFSFLGWKLFRRKNLVYPNNNHYFVNFEDVLWEMYVSVTTANLPDVMMPAYNVHGLYSLYFIVFMLINFYLFVNILLASIYSNFKKHLREEVKESLRFKRRKLEQAFNKLQNNGAINMTVFTTLILFIDPRKSQIKIEKMFQILDYTNKRSLEINDFLFLADLLSVRISESKDRETFLQKHLECYNGEISQTVKNLPRKRYFGLTFDFAILVNAVSLILDSHGFEWLFLILFFIEIGLKLYSFGTKQFLSRYWNVFDVVIIVIGVVVIILEASIDKTGISVEFILILRLLRFLKLLSSFKRFRTIITTIVNITPSLRIYTTLILTVYYAFAMIGMEVFNKKIRFVPSQNQTDCGNPLLKGSDFAVLQYCKNNFENVVHSFILLFELMVVNQWHVLADGFVKVTSKYARIYFITFHMFCVIISLNIFTAFVIEAFFIDYEQDEKCEFEKRIEEKILELHLNIEDDFYNQRSETEALTLRTLYKRVSHGYLSELPVDFSKIKGVRCHVHPNGPKSIDILMQRMFANEFNITSDEIKENNNDTQQELNSTN